MGDVTVAYCEVLITISGRVPKGAYVKALIPLARARIQAEIHSDTGDFSFFPTPYESSSASEWCKIGGCTVLFFPKHGQENLEDAKLWSKLRLLEKVRILEMQMESKDPKAVQIELEDDPSQERIKFAAGFCEFSTRTYINKWIKDAWSPITTPPEAKRFVMERIGLASEEDWTGSCVCVPKTDRGNHWKHGGLIMFLPDERDRELAEGTLLKQARLYRLYLAQKKLEESTGKAQDVSDI